jgi:hypothetical protein
VRWPRLTRAPRPCRRIFWVGDLNYRISLPDAECRSLVAAGNMAKLLAKDQLLEQKAAGRAFTHFTEPEIAFLPTYRYDPGTDRWDTRHVRSVAALRARRALGALAHASRWRAARRSARRHGATEFSIAARESRVSRTSARLGCAGACRLTGG